MQIVVANSPIRQCEYVFGDAMLRIYSIYSVRDDHSTSNERTIWICNGLIELQLFLRSLNCLEWSNNKCASTFVRQNRQEKTTATHISIVNCQRPHHQWQCHFLFFTFGVAAVKSAEKRTNDDDNNLLREIVLALFLLFYFLIQFLTICGCGECVCVCVYKVHRRNQIGKC